MIGSRRMFATFSNGRGRHIEASYSLNGLSAALLYIDERHNRLGSQRIAGPPTGDRHVLKSDKPDTSKPIDVANIAETKHEATKNKEWCIANGAESYAVGTPVSKLDDKKSLAIILCATHAYNISFNIYVVDHETRQAAREHFAVFSPERGWTATDILSNVDFDQETKQLSMFHKARGLGDCGIGGLWQWTEFGFKMISFHSKDDCDGKDNDWPQIFPVE